MEQERLQRLMGSRSDGHWELFATAVGNGTSVRRTLEGLSSVALVANVGGPAISPSIVEQRVQALAAFDTQRLADLSREWKDPSELSLDLMDASVDFWTSAWRSSLRFLVLGGEVPKLEGLLPLPLEIEKDVLLEAEELELNTWDDLTHHVRDTATYSDLRALDRAKVSVDRPVTRARLVEFLGGESPSTEALERLRVLQHRTVFLDSSAQDYLGKLLLSEWEAAEELDNTGALTILMDVALECSNANGLRPRLVRALTQRLRASVEPARWAPFAYLLAGTNWRCP